MSAFLCDDNHISYLVQALREFKGRSFIGGSWIAPEELFYDDEAQRVANMLYRENLLSYRFRYPDERPEGAPDGELISPDEEISCRYTDPARVFEPVQVLKAAQCYEYQACEHPGWETSDACTTIRQLTKAAIARLPGYEKALWGAPEPDPNLHRLLPRVASRRAS